jgi:hypothetical protein
VSGLPETVAAVLEDLTALERSYIMRLLASPEKSAALVAMVTDVERREGPDAAAEAFARAVRDTIEHNRAANPYFMPDRTGYRVLTHDGIVEFNTLSHAADRVSGKAHSTDATEPPPARVGADSARGTADDSPGDGFETRAARSME